MAEDWFKAKAHRKPKTVAGYRSPLDTVVLPKWKDVALKGITYESYSQWLGMLAIEGPQKGQVSLLAGSHKLTS
ncbi:hypothetical protein [Mycobacterium sp. JS623]|uniref:hypothetical protein n=1 Tax=Mycobacterium sp. JS623 TaxID=212767 RepID=UPI0002FCC702|nr:hypothetical protein [Mycobacterium sp. JS623]